MKGFRYTLFTVLVSVFCFVTPHSVKAQTTNNGTSSIADAQVESIKDTGKENTQNHQKILQVQLKILSGDLKGKEFTIQDNVFALPYQIHYNQGSKVIVAISDDGRGGKTVYITDYDRRPILLLLLALFLALILLVSKKQGALSLLGMIISFYIIAQIIIPQILLGTNAFVITIIGVLIIIPATYYLAHGFNKKTTIAVIGTFITLILVAALSYVFSYFGNLTGYANEEAVFLQNMFGSTINVFSLLLAGIIIGGVAVLNDITISQASIVNSLKKSNRNLPFRQLYSHAMDVGRDHVASLVNTLVLVYVGAAFPLVLLFYKTHTDLSLILNQEIIATEIIRTLVTSIGIVAAVPITTYIACLMNDRS